MIEGVPELRPVTHRTVPDRIVAGTWAVAAAITQGRVDVRGANPAHLTLCLEKLRSAGASIEERSDGFVVEMSERPRAVDIVTLPYPGFPHRSSAPVHRSECDRRWSRLVTENLFEARFRFVRELARLGADVQTDGTMR